MSYLLRTMGNCLPLCRSNKNSSSKSMEHETILRIAKSDGKILEYRTSILVKDLLVNFIGFAVCISQENSQHHLPPNYELKIGHMYYLVSCPDYVDSTNTSDTSDDDRVGGLKRIKVIITKQQLQELLSKKISIEDIILSLQGTWDGVDSPRSWQPKLETIPEENQ